MEKPKPSQKPIPPTGQPVPGRPGARAAETAVAAGTSSPLSPDAEGPVGRTVPNVTQGFDGGENEAEADDTQFDPEQACAEILNELRSPEAATPTQAATQPLPQEAGPSQTSKVLRGTANVLGDFKLTKKLGEGGMGAVFEATQTSLDRTVAIKVLAKHLANNKDFVARFQREAKIMAKIDHPNVLRCYAFGEDRGVHYFAMEYVDGGSMETWLRKLGRLRVGDALHVLIACADALQHAHEQNLIHRDIKPDNILLTKKGVVKVADLGLAKATTEDMGLTKTGTGAGTPIYMSPEQSRDVKNVDARADIYSLGCMLYAFITGRPPFLGETVVELFEAKEKGKFPPARTVSDEVPERLDLIIDKMLARKPEIRYQSCAALLEDLRGLGLANATLGFLLTDGSKPQRVAVPAGSKSGTVAKTVALSEPKPGARGPVAPNKPTANPKVPSSKPSPVATPGDWYLSYKNKEGKPIKRKMTTAQVIELLKDDYFDPKTQATRTLDGPYRLLASYKEFEGALRGRITRAQADKKTAKFQSMYAQLEKEQISRERWRWFRNMFHGAVGYAMLAMWLAVIGGVLVGGYFVVKKFIWPALDQWFTKMTQ